MRVTYRTRKPAIGVLRVQYLAGRCNKYGERLEIWSGLTMPEEKSNGFKEMLGRRDAGVGADLESNKLYLPLQFFFCVTKAV